MKQNKVVKSILEGDDLRDTVLSREVDEKESVEKFLEYITSVEKYASNSEGETVNLLLDWKDATVEMKKIIMGGTDFYVENNWNEDDSKKTFERETGIPFSQLERAMGDNTSNNAYLAPDVNIVIYEDNETKRYFLELRLHLGGDVRGNYTGGFYKEGKSVEELMEYFHELLPNYIVMTIKFQDGSLANIMGNRAYDVPVYEIQSVDSKPLDPDQMLFDFGDDFEMPKSGQALVFQQYFEIVLKNRDDRDEFVDAIADKFKK